MPSPGNSSHLSTKSDKNMADFEGEDVLSEEELAHINAHAHFVAAAVLVRDTGHHTMQHHLANMASSYDVPLEKGGWGCCRGERRCLFRLSVSFVVSYLGLVKENHCD